MRIALAPAAALLACGLVLSSTPAQAGTSFDFLFDIAHVSNDNQYFLNLAVGRYGYERPDLEPVLPRVRSLDNDLPVAMFLAHETDRPLNFIVDLRSKGLSWSVVMTRLSVSPAVLFVGIDRDPGPPYGHAWGYWRQHPKGYAYSDEDVAGLVKVQVGARYARMSTYEMAQARGKGHRVPTLVAEHKGRPYQGKGAKSQGHGDDDQGEDEGHGHGHGRGHGQDQEHGPEGHHGPGY